MKRWKEIAYSLGFNILFPRFMLFVAMPCGMLLYAPIPDPFPPLSTILAPTSAKVILSVGLLLFGLNITANLNISPYLSLHQTESSPYAYAAEFDLSTRTREKSHPVLSWGR